MTAPNLTAVDLQRALSEISGVAFLATGGQKQVFSCAIGPNKYAIKVLKPDARASAASLVTSTTGMGVSSLDEVTARVQREIRIMKECDTPHLVKIGPIELRSITVGGETLLCYSEELVDGSPLNQVIRTASRLSPAEVIQLGLDVAAAIDVLWARQRIHRDIKPGNIMRRSSGRFVLLDLGLVFDLNDESYSISPVGTQIYFSPEQMDFASRRKVLDFRSDLFALGVTMYEASTGIHPFLANAHTSWDVMNNIRNVHPRRPTLVHPTIPDVLSDVIMQLLGKSPALRFRTIDRFRQALAKIQGGP